ncbi:hypothetical protein [Flavobacterium sp. PL02]|uniref:hypothetical protein n=1 Tax=Flavobacterium sp. PL02 TaxID=3088354 RepID=UPI002B2363E1|nr:hypothetical protein [Flavobacterium sp. PL02]MEA9412594.1 hypothetical protein [Flavobacterium sp. PL02]
MMKKSQFEESIFIALNKSYVESQIFNLSFDGNVTKMTEYFITVNLCKELLNWNKKNHYPYKIEAEKNTFDLYKDCFENYKPKDKDSIFSPTIFSSNFQEFLENLKKIRKGKVDIALSTEKDTFNNISEYIFEVKAINPTINKLKEDFERIQNYINAEIPYFCNSLKGGFIVFIKHHNTEKKIQNREYLIKERDKYITKLKQSLSDLSNKNIISNINTNTIELSDYEGLHVFDGDDFGEIAYKTFFAYSVIIEIKK